jgi:transcriptional regulator with XRE-family HTH domain
MPTKPKSRLPRLREQAGLTQVQLAVLVGVTPNTIQNWEKDNGLEQLERYLKLAEIFGCNVSDLVEYVPASEQEKPLSKGFSLEELRQLRKKWGTDTNPELSAPTTKTTSQKRVKASDNKSSINSPQTDLEHHRSGT